MCCLKGSEGLTTARCVPDITTCIGATHLLVVGRNLNTVENSLGSNNLVRSHNQKQVLTCQNTVFGNDIEQSVLLEEGLCKIHEVGNNLVVGICPEGSELKTTACLLNLLLAVSFLDGTDTGGVRVVLGAGAVRDNEQLHILIKTATSPKTVPLVSINLVKRLSEWFTTALQLNVNQRETVYKDGNIVTVVKVTAVLYILVNDLYRVVVDVLLINQSDVLA